MWKKIVIVCIVLFGGLSVGYAYYNSNLEASTNSSGGNISGSLGPLKQGNHFYIHTNHYSFVVAGNDQGNSDMGTLALSDTAIGSVKWDNGSNYYSVSDYRKFIQNMNDTIDSKDVGMIIKEFSKPSLPAAAAHHWTHDFNALPSNEMPYFIGAPRVFVYFGNVFTEVDLTMLEKHLINGTWLGDCDTNGYYSPRIWDNGLAIDTTNASTRGLQPSILLNNQEVVFAASKPNDTSDISTVDESGTDRMQLRMKDNNLSVNLDSVKINKNGTEIEGEKIIAGTELVVHYSNATIGTGNTVSLIVKKDGSWVYYKRLGTGNASGSSEIDTSDWDEGSYEFVLVNEVLTNDMDPTVSSELSSSISIDVVPCHEITYTKTAQSGATSGNDYEYSKNVNGGSVVGKITLNPTGITPITYSIESNGDNTYQNFEIDGLDSNGASSATTLNVKIKNNASDLDNNSLKAGTYNFCIVSTDANGYPDTQIDGKTKVCTSFDVKKTNLGVSFDDPNQTKKTIAEAGNTWNETATATLDHGTKVTYTKVGGDIGMIDIDSNTGAITYKGNNAFGKVKIKATVDDDPNTGNDNYNPAYAEKEIVIVREVDATITPDPASSDITIPTYSMDQANIKTGGTIGKIQGILGTPDTIGGSTTTYRYELKNGQDSGMFRVNANTGAITSGANLGVDTYNFNIIVSDKWSSKEIPVTVNVGMAPAEVLKFYENASSNTIITKKSAKVTDTGITVFATVKGSSNHNPVTYKLKDGESTNVIDVNPNSGAVTIKNVGKVIIVAEKKGATGQADAYAELEFTVTAGSQEFIYVDESGNELPKTLDKYQTYEEVYGKDKTFKVHTDGNPAGTNVTYELKNTSPTDVITVDEDGTIHILNASLNKQKGQVIVLATSHDPAGNYTDKTIELPIDITKADQKISFADVTHAPNGSGRVTPLITEQDLSGNAGGANVEDPDYYISVGQAGNGIAWTNNGIDIEYDYDEEEGIIIPLHVEKEGNRNYNKAEADGTLKILGQEESTLAINQPGKVVYGDHFTIRSLQDDSSGANVQYTFEVDNTIYISQPNINGNKAEFDALKNSGNTEISIKVTRTADGEVALSKTIKVKVLPKDINIKIDDKEKKQGEENPELTFQDFQDQLVSWNGVKDQVDSDDVKLTTTATTTSKGGSYPITGNPKELNGKYPNYNFIFKDGKLMVEGMIDKDVDDDGKPDFNDPDGDGCPDLNIKWKDDSGNWVVINGDRDYDGIPDLNIDSDGDGIPDLNIDTDTDGKPDINLVILKKTDWKPTRCVVQSTTVKEEYCTGTSSKPRINVDTDNDNVPDINIDTNGDMKADINIDINKDNIADVNLNTIETWKPNKDYKHQNFLYDTMDPIKPYLNIDTNGDNCPDINLDTDQDGIADLNIDTDDDQIPNVNIDSTGNGKADMNLDTNDDGIPDENIIEVTEWKPDKKVGDICTMVIKQNTELEDNGIKVEKPDGTSFLPNFALKVEDVTNTKQTEITTDAKEFIEEKQEVKKVYDVKLLKDGVEVKPDGMIKVKIPYEGINNPILIRKNNNGSYEKIHYTIEQGYLVYETEELGIVSIIGDKETNTSVMGTYTPNIGGALTGDETGIHLNLLLMFISFLVLMILKSNKQKDTFQ